MGHAILAERNEIMVGRARDKLNEDEKVCRLMEKKETDIAQRKNKKKLF